MLTRRHLRAKVMQALYAYRQSHSQDMAVAEKNLLTGIDRIMDLYAMQTALLFSVVRMADAKIEARRGKRFATPEELNPNMKFVRNPVLAAMEENKKLSEAASKYASSWADRSEYVEAALGQLEASPKYGEYMDSQDDSFGTHKRFAIYVFKNVIAPSDALLDYYEDCNMEWAADIQVANTMLLKTMEDIKEENPSGFEIPSLYKDEGDREFAVRLLRETEKGSAQYKAMIEQKAENWDSERIAMVDFILMEMAIAEFMSFPSIPTKVTLNEYIEISKDYSTAKSRIFVNGILDRILAWLEADGKIKKAGRGLM